MKKSIGCNGTRGTMRTVTTTAVTMLIDKRPDRYHNPQLTNHAKFCIVCEIDLLQIVYNRIYIIE